jgi:PAS domain S-box-containing protein
MDIPLRVLIIEDSDRDVALELRALKAAGYQVTYVVVETAAEMKATLIKQAFDIVISDHDMPQFDAAGALAVLKQSGLDIPFIIVSGAIGEETAVALMKAGAHDYVMKDKLARLVPAVQRELREAESRRVRKKAEQAQVRLVAMLEATPGFVGYADAKDTHIIYINTAGQKMIGVQAQEDVTQLKIADVHPEWTNKLFRDEIIPTAIRDGLWTGECAFLNRDGHEIPVMMTLLAHKSPSGEVERFSTVSIDITDRKQAEEKLLESKTLIETVVENVPLMIFLKEATDLRFVIFNRAGEELLGYDRKDLLGKNDLDLFPPEQAAHFMAKDREVLDGKAGVMDIPEEPIQTAKKGQRLLHTKKVCIRSADGATKYLLGISEDITERKEAEEALRESEELLKSYLENAPDGIYMSDLQGTFLYGNRRCEELIGYRREELIGRNFLEFNLLSENSLDKAVQLLQANMEDKSTGPDEIDLINKEGRLIPVEINTNVIQRIGQRIVIASVRDITERKRAEEQLRQTLESLRKAVNTTIQVMVSAVESRDPYTSGHQTRSADLARAIATEMGLPQDTIEGIRMAGSIHDIGKLSIPAEILSKPTKLTNIEFSLIKEHSLKGFEMLKDVESPWPLAEIVYQHHERMNGSGYPRNLKGDGILMEARILAVSDVVEAMASHRPYRPGLGIDLALEEIEKNRGTFYDNAVADACLRLFREKGFKLEEHRF